jgi:MFS family permease
MSTARSTRVPHLSMRTRLNEPVGPRYRWVVLSNTTLAMLLATLNVSSVMIALPAIFRGIRLDPLGPGNFNYLLWMLMGYMVVTAVLVVNFGRLGDMYGRVRMYNLGFLVFTVASILLALVWSTGPAGALELISLRMVQAVGGAMLFANTAALLTDAFPEEQRGLALGLNQVVGLAGTFIGLIAGGLLAEVDWRLVFVVNVPVGIAGTIWSYWQLRELGTRTAAHFDWFGNLFFAIGLSLALIGITYGIRPLRRAHDGLAEPVRACDPGHRYRAAPGVRSGRATCLRADVPALALPDPAVRRRQRGRILEHDRSWRLDVHARDLVAGGLAARARLQL